MTPFFHVLLAAVAGTFLACKASLAGWMDGWALLLGLACMGALCLLPIGRAS